VGRWYKNDCEKVENSANKKTKQKKKKKKKQNSSKQEGEEGGLVEHKPQRRRRNHQEVEGTVLTSCGSLLAQDARVRLKIITSRMSFEKETS